MIDGICVPCRASKINDVKIRIDLLKKVEGKFPIGLQVIGTISDFIDPTKRKTIIGNLAEAKEFGAERVTIHSPLSLLERENYSSKSTNLSEPESLEILKAVFDLANQVEAKVVTVHCEIYHTLIQMKSLTDEKRQKLKESAAKNLSKLDKGSVILGIENMPYPTNGDVFFCSTDGIFDPLFADPLELYEFTKETSAEITFDTCHWSTLLIPIPLIDMFRKIEDRVCDIHLSDAYGRWIDGISRFKEGVIPGEGNLGEYNFRQLLSYLRGCKKSTILTIEVKDRNYENPEESRESLTRILSWLNK